MNKLIRLKDKFVTHDNAGLRGEMIFGIGKHQIPFIDPFGNKSFKTVFDKVLHRDHNIVTIGGYQFAFDKMFNIAHDNETTLRVANLNDESPLMKIGVPRSEYLSNYYNAETNIGSSVAVNPKGGINISGNDFIFGFMIGDGGSREDNITAIAPDYKNRMLYNAIPFRMSNDGYAFPAGTYFGKQSAYIDNDETIDYYYIKKFDDPSPHIVHAWVSDSDSELDIVDDTVFSSTSSTPIESYVEINISVSEFDARGYFTTTGTNPRINEFGLVSGWYNPNEDDYECLQLITHFTRSSLLLEEGDSIEAVYRLYAR